MIERYLQLKNELSEIKNEIALVKKELAQLSEITDEISLIEADIFCSENKRVINQREGAKQFRHQPDKDK